MSIEIKVPVLPESVADATIASWHRQPGESIFRDENIVDLETDKVVLEVPSPVDGTIIEIREVEGETVVSGQVIAIIEEGEVEAAPVDSGVGADTETATDSTAPPEAGKPADTEKLAPSVRRMVSEENLDAKDIKGSGRGQRITKKDVLEFISGGGSRHQERVKMTRLRSRIAERMKEAQNTAAILTSFNEVDLKAVMDLRKKYKEQFIETHGVKLGLMSFFVKASCEALKKHPIVNASLDGNEIVYHNYMDIGIAVSTDRGLMVPVLRNAENMSLAQIELNIAEYARRARDGSISLEDIQGGTFSITNGGVFGSLVSTPLLNPPQSAILGMHTIKERPVVVNGDIVARPMMFTALSYDHRIIDGKEAVQYLVAIKNALEDPARLLLGL
ncbi:MAG: dihydrolipoyllysine-residue succinyltransferase [Xanthomonadales bacterium]|nr:dihydrolipoyllysine-residue succinyltransferase [Xanthomonadales bacterium]